MRARPPPANRTITSTIADAGRVYDSNIARAAIFRQQTQSNLLARGQYALAGVPPPPPPPPAPKGVIYPGARYSYPEVSWVGGTQGMIPYKPPTGGGDMDEKPKKKKKKKQNKWWLKAAGAEKKEEEESDDEEALFESDPKYNPPFTVTQVEFDRTAVPPILPYVPDIMGDDFTVLEIGKRREGKSFFTRFQLYHMRGLFSQVFVFTNTKINGFWQTMVPEEYIYEGVDPFVLQALIDHQKKLVEYTYANPDKNINPRACIIFDDCIDQNMHHMPPLKTLFYNGRHLKCCVFFNIQYAKGLPPGMRENADLAVIFRTHSDTQTEAIAENFLGHWNKESVINILDSYIWKDDKTEQRQAVVVDQSGHSPLSTSIYAAQPVEVPPFVLGCRAFWDKQEPHTEPEASPFWPRVEAPNPMPKKKE